MARVPYVDPPPIGADDPDELRALYAEVTAARGTVLDLYRALANAPAALRAYLVLSRHVRDRSSLDPRLRELAILATAYALDVDYEQVHHVRAARHVGVSDRQLAAFPAWRDAPALFGPLERAVLAYADEVARARTVSEATFAAVRDSLSPTQLVDLALTVAFYHLCAAIILPLGIEPEAT